LWNKNNVQVPRTNGISMPSRIMKPHKLIKFPRDPILLNYS
jgi:hypothetical protein